MYQPEARRACVAVVRLRALSLASWLGFWRIHEKEGN
jgi:hypothetical protein